MITMYEGSEEADVENVHQDGCDPQAVELSIVILVDGEEKCCSKIGKAAVRPCGSNHRGVCNAGQQSTSRPTTPTINPSPSASSLSSNKKAATARCPYENNNFDKCGNCGQPFIIPTPQSKCPCAAFQNAPCGTSSFPLARVPSQTAACQTIAHGQCQTDPVNQGMQMQPCMQAQTKTQNQSSACQTGAYGPVPPSPSETRPCTKRKTICQKKAKSAICQTQAQPQSTTSLRPQTAEQTKMLAQGQPPCAAQAVYQPRESSAQIQSSSPCAPALQALAQTICQTVPVEPGPYGQLQQTTVTITATCPEGTYAKSQVPPSEEPTPIGEISQVPRSKEDKVRKVRRHSKEESSKETPEVRKARKSSLPPEQLNFSNFPSVQLNFVDYFLKSEGGVASVLTLAETKLEYEKKCKSLLANMPNSKRSQAEDFFNKIIEAVQVKVPESNNTEIKHYHLVKYLQPIVSALQLQAHDELHTIHKYHNYILSVVNFMEDRLRQRETINPDALIDVETHLLAGIMSRLYPIFIKLKDAAIGMSTQKDSPNIVPSEDFVKHLRKLILAIYVEIVCIDVTFNNTLTSLSYLPDVDVQEKYRHQLAIRKKHARHSVTWAARCITTAVLYYHVGTSI